MKSFLSLALFSVAALAAPFPAGEWDLPTDPSAAMVAGISRFLDRETELAKNSRASLWRDFDPETRAHRLRELQQVLGLASASTNEPGQQRFQRLPISAVEIVSSTSLPDPLLTTASHTVHAVRWPVFAHYAGEGLWLKPARAATARVIVLPDADQSPESLLGLLPGATNVSPGLRALIGAGAELFIPALISRSDEHSGNPRINRFTNQPHREWLYRQGYQVGQTMIGSEVAMVLSLVDLLASQAKSPIGVAGYGEGGVIALYAAAIDGRIASTLVSGYFGPRENLYEEPIYRNLFGFLSRFGDAEIAALIAPRSLIIEYSDVPKVSGPPQPRERRSGAAPGKLVTPERYRVEEELGRARDIAGAAWQSVRLMDGNEGRALEPFSMAAIGRFAAPLLGREILETKIEPWVAKIDLTSQVAARQERLVRGLESRFQEILRYSEQVRDQAFWQSLRGVKAAQWSERSAPLKRQLWEEVLGKFTNSPTPLNPRARQIYDTEKYTGFEVTLDVFEDVFAWGILLLPKNLTAGEQRPVVVCQHGLEGVPRDAIEDRPEAFQYYKGFAGKLAEQGYITFAPHNPYRGRDAFRVLQRKANPLGKSLFSVILAQHGRTVEWLGSLDFVDPSRIAFYGLSYGGKTAMRVPPLIEGYCLSICSADFNEWNKKNATVESAYSYLYTIEYEMPEWNLAHTFNYSEMAALIAPRPFMVERGHDDGVAPDEWVAHEFARVRRFYNRLGIGDRTEIEFFDGPHTINGEGTYRFLNRHLGWPNAK